MDHFVYREGRLHAEEVPIDTIAERVATPVYVYSSATLERHFRVFDAALAPLDRLTCFAVKANANRSVLATLARLGAGADVVSGGELGRALAAGIAPERIVFSGVGKTRAEMAQAMEAGIFQFNVESTAELVALDAVARAFGSPAPVALRINPDVESGTHEKIATGRRDTKFGIPWDEAMAAFALARRLPGIAVQGVDVHIGSQLTRLEPFATAFTRVAGLVHELRAAGHAIRTLDLGGGLGIPYDREGEEPPSPAEYGAMVHRLAEPLDCLLITEPGRLIAGNAGVLLSRVVHVKEAAGRRFIILDAGMNDLLRPALYGARHEIVPVVEPVADAPRTPADVVGPVCETADRFARDVPLPPLEAGDLVVLRSAGAYGASMASTYNGRDLVPEVLVRGREMAVVRERRDWRHFLSFEPPAPWLDLDKNAPEGSQ
ncbi:MAG: diaminopimelate decarboxylase [Alphaproteobacteria bacterium]|nr:MAG: diaminopimelate decarboxylase [Alphaproteobacteria bacterium]